MGQLLSNQQQAGGDAVFRQVPVPNSDVSQHQREDLDEEVDEAVQFTESQPTPSAFNKSLDSRRFVRSSPTDDFELFVYQFAPVLTKYIHDQQQQHPTIRVAVFLYPTYEKVVCGGAGELPRPPVTPILRTKLITVLREASIPDAIHTLLEALRARHVNFMRGESGLRLEALSIADVEIARVKHLNYAGSAFATLPKFLANKTAIVNVQNKDERCFGYALLSALHPAASGTHGYRSTTYDKYFAEHPELADLEYPVLVDQLQDVERQIHIAFNVFSFHDDEGRARYPLYLSSDNPDTAIDLLFWNGHFAWIKNFSRFLADQSSNGHVHCYCKRCFGRFTSESVFRQHQTICQSMDGVRQIYTMPEEGTQLEFRNMRYQVKFPFTVYADFEALTTPHTRTDPAVDMKNCVQKHIPISVGLKLLSSAPGVLDNVPYETYTGLDVAEWFLRRLLDYRTMVNTYLYDTKRLIMTEADESDFADARVCYSCRKPFPADDKAAKKGQRKVRDHDHITGTYRGAAHSKCNLYLRRQNKLPVFIHNFRGYDSHLIVPAFTQFKGMDIDVIGQGLEKYLTLTFDKTIVMKDSLQFLGGSLLALVECLKKAGKDRFRQLRAGFVGITDDAGIDMLLRKGVYPYDYMDNIDRLNEAQLPTRESFFSKLANKECSVQDYNFATTAWTKFGCKKMQDYHDLYLKTDVLLLADVFESFRDATLSQLGLDPAYYVSAPQLSWDCMMKMTECKLTLLSDPAMFDLIHNNLRGGISVISKRHARANNKYMGDAYDPSVRSSYLLYVDANNLCGHAMSQSLPYDNFEWVSAEDCEGIDWLTQTDDQATGYFVECHLHYPDTLHDAHNDYPLAPERVVVHDHLLSATQTNVREQYAISHAATAKLVPNFFDKTNMLLHYRNLRFYLEQGIQLTKVHKAIRFRQAKWLEPYIRVNTELRARSKDPVEVKLRKDMNNSIYGKTCENLTKRTDIKLVNTQKQCDKLIAKPHCLRHQVFAPQLAAIELQKVKCMINKPTYVGFAVLELSKLHMFKFHYEYFKRWYPDSELLFTDTDSFLYQVYTDDLYTDLAAHSEHFDFSSYPPNHPLFSDENKMVLGKMKDEAAGGIINEFVGLRPKMYSYTTLRDDGDEPKESKRAKGIQKATITNLRHADYVAQLKVSRENYVNIRRIGQKHHRVFTVDGIKRGLCAFDDKRYLRKDGIRTYAHGHYSKRDKQTQAAEIVNRIASEPHSLGVRDDGEDFDARSFLTLSHNESVRRKLRPKVRFGEAVDILGGVDLRPTMDLMAQRHPASNAVLSSDGPFCTPNTSFRTPRTSAASDDDGFNDTEESDVPDFGCVASAALSIPMNDWWS